MAQRPIFLPTTSGSVLVRTEILDFQWHAGMSVPQKQRSIASLHEAGRRLVGASRILEVSSKSPEPLGVELSAFNLPLAIEPSGATTTVECAFQASKVFVNGGPFDDIFHMSSREAKRDQRLRSSGNLTGFRFDHESWPLEPQTAFYDWLYMQALRSQPAMCEELKLFDAFTDIEFNPSKSINCQAYSAALFISLSRRGEFDAVMSSRSAYLDFLNGYSIQNAHQDDQVQGRLF